MRKALLLTLAIVVTITGTSLLLLKRQADYNATVVHLDWSDIESKNQHLTGKQAAVAEFERLTGWHPEKSGATNRPYLSAMAGMPTLDYLVKKGATDTSTPAYDILRCEMTIKGHRMKMELNTRAGDMTDVSFTFAN